MFWLGFLAGAVVASFVFIMWGHKNKNKIDKAREAIKDAAEDVTDAVEDVFD